MKPLILVLVAALTALAHGQEASHRPPEGPYPVDPDSVRQDGVPRGTVTQYRLEQSEIFPGTERDYWIYVPAQYDGIRDAALMIFQDGRGFVAEKAASQAPVVFDNLIHKGEMPVTIGLFINPGEVPARDEDAQPRFNRSFEYDAVDDRFARFLIEEMLPLVEREYRISPDPNLRGICGSSSGGIAAFVAAWHRPDAFRRVYTMVGTYVGLRGGNELPVLVRKTEPKPLRVFLQDGSNDNNIYCGDWWVANQDMLSALQFSGYEVNHVWGEGYHGQKHGAAIFPEAMRWLWQGHPEAVTTHYENCRSRAPELLIDGEDWELVSEGHGFTEGPAWGPDGALYFSDLERGQILRLKAGGSAEVVWDVAKWMENKRLGFTIRPPAVNGLAFGPDGLLYACFPGLNRVAALDPATGEMVEELTSEVRTNDIVVSHDGTVYFTEPGRKAVWMKRPGEAARIAGEGFSGVNGVVLSPDQTQVYVTDYERRYAWAGQVESGGELRHLQPYIHLHVPPAAIDVRSEGDGLCVDRSGWVLVATAMGVQISDQLGRVNLILPPPHGARHPANVTFGGEDRDVLFATCGDKVFRRRVRLKGALAWEAPLLPPKPKL